MAITVDRIQKIDLILKTIPFYEGNCNTLNAFISSVDLVHDVLNTINPALDAFESSTTFLSMRSKIVGKALDSIKDLEIRSWTTLREVLIGNFSDKSNSITILNSILNIENVKNPTLFFDLIKGKFNNFQLKLYVENEEADCRKAISDFVEKLVITHFITNLNDPFRNNLATRNPRSLNELEKLVRNDLQYLKTEHSGKPTQGENNHHGFRQEAKKPIYRTNYVQNRPTHGHHNNNNYNNNYNRNNNNNNHRNTRLPHPEPMSVQTRQVSRPWQRESFNANERQSSAQNPENQFNFETIENSFLELGRIDIDENP